MLKIKKDPTKVFWSSDLYLNHTNLCKATSQWPDSEKCRDFTSIPHMNKTILEGINDNVNEDSTLFLLGDLLFGQDKDYVALLDNLRCKDVRIIHGNHDNVNKLKLIGDKYYGAEFKLVLNSTYIHAHHHPILSWDNMNQGSFHLFGHCIDKDTEIATTKGWKNVDNISKDDIVFSYTTKGKIETSVIKNIFKYEGDTTMYRLKGKSISFNTTKEHRQLVINHKGEELYLTSDQVSKYKSRLKFVLSGSIENKGIDLSDDLIRLYVLLSADGNMIKRKGYYLGRVSLYKDRKILFVRDLLCNLGISFTESKHKDSRVCFNFVVPNDLMNYNIKGLDYKLLNMSEQQVDVLVDTYSKTDGTKYDGHTSIFTSKKEEFDILQILLPINNYSCTGLSRIHGFGKKMSYSISANKGRNYTTMNNLHKKLKEDDYSGKYWCIETEHGNFLCRRDNKVHFTGNCHSSIEQGNGPIADYMNERRCLDVGIDNAYHLLGEYIPFRFDWIVDRLSNHIGSSRI